MADNVLKPDAFNERFTKTALLAAFALFAAGDAAHGQPLTWLHGDPADSPVALGCLIHGGAETCEMSVIPYCEKHKSELMGTGMAQSCIRVEKAEEARRTHPPTPAAMPSESPWVLLGLDVFMGAVSARDTARDADTVSVYGEGLPVFQTAAACQAALRNAIEKYAGRSHAEGNSGRFLCADWRTWATSPR